MVEVWGNIKDDLVDFMRELKDARLEKANLKAIRRRLEHATPLLAAYVAKQPALTITPSLADLYHVPELHDIFARPVDEIDGDDVTEDEIVHAFRRLPQISEQWREDKLSFLAGLLPRLTPNMRLKKGTKSDAADVSWLGLATSFFLCTYCHKSPCSSSGRVWHASNILAHRDTPYCVDLTDNPIASIAWTAGSVPWNYNNRVVFDNQAFEAAGRIITLCGLDPQHTTVADMDVLNKRLVCTVCTADGLKLGRLGRVVMRWRSAVSISALQFPPSAMIKYASGRTYCSVLEVGI